MYYSLGTRCFFLSLFFLFSFSCFHPSHQAKAMKANAGVLLWAFDLCFPLHLFPFRGRSSSGQMDGKQS